MFQERKDSSDPVYSPISQPDVCYDPEKITLEGRYSDELSAYRAKRNWQETFETYFLLDEGDDFELNVIRDQGAHNILLTCCFFSACGRYAFWRLTNDQAPEAQYRIETAHVPNAESRYADFVASPDLRRSQDGPLLLNGWGKPPEINHDWIQRFKEMLERFRNLPKK
ncbi:MAG: hypothetical protein KDD55_11910 [Bdellovibrionales bacterium]|nr:hypothetical protein [Bdellovibrionales bacterium]